MTQPRTPEERRAIIERAALAADRGVNVSEVEALVQRFNRRATRQLKRSVTRALRPAIGLPADSITIGLDKPGEGA